jgi:hypothetical protein
MPKSDAPRSRSSYTPPTGSSAKPPSPQWYKVTMLTLLVLGLAWIVVTYVSSVQLPIAAIGQWNLAVGFGLILVGFGMTTRWR